MLHSCLCDQFAIQVFGSDTANRVVECLGVRSFVVKSHFHIML